MSGIVFYVIDLETTGLKVGYHEPTEIGIIRAVDRVQLWRNIKCERPENASYDALAITKKTLVDLQNGFDLDKVVEECDRFFSEDGLTPAHRCIVGHNIFTFDKKFLHNMWEKFRKEFPAHLWLDTIPMTRHYAKQIGLVKPKVNLHAACDITGVKKLSSAHNAKTDTRNTYLLWKNLVEDKKVDYLPFVKTAIHTLPVDADLDDVNGGGLDPSLLDID